MDGHNFSSPSLESIKVLLKVLDDIEQRNVNLQKLCCERRKLFKPWPNKKDKDQTTVEEHGSVQESGNSQDTLSAVEKTELAMMDKLLNKAQRARNVQQSVSFNTDGKIKESGRVPKQATKDQIKDTKVKDNIQSVSEIRDTDNLTVDNHKKNTSTKHGKTQEDVVKGHPSSKPITSAPKSVTTRPRQDKVIIRESSSAGFRNKKVLPAHVKAPFQTNPRLSVPKRQVDKRISSGAKYKSASLPQTSNRKPTVKNDDQFKVKEDEVIEKLESGDNDTDIMTQEKEMVKTNLDCDQNLDPVVSMQETDVKNVTKKVENCQLKDDTVLLQKEIEKRFCLITDGKNLSIPGKLRRLHANNTRLREKMKLERVTKKVDVCTSKQDFLTRLESTFEKDEAQRIGRSITIITNIYKNLFNFLKNVSLETISESSPGYDVLRAKNMVEFILTVFYQTEEERRKLDPDLLTKVVHKRCTAEVIQPQSSQTSLFWLDSILPYCHGVHKMYAGPSTCLQYKNLKDLNRYIALVFQIQSQQLNQKLLDSIAVEIFPLLSSNLYTPSETVWIFRSLYSILSLDQMYPVLVKDTIQELEDSDRDT